MTSIESKYFVRLSRLTLRPVRMAAASHHNGNSGVRGARYVLELSFKPQAGYLLPSAELGSKDASIMKV